MSRSSEVGRQKSSKEKSKSRPSRTPPPAIRRFSSKKSASRGGLWRQGSNSPVGHGGEWGGGCGSTATAAGSAILFTAFLWESLCRGRLGFLNGEFFIFTGFLKGKTEKRLRKKSK
ncbi:sister chromatid cohesion protein PDS5 homologA-A [Striga asiatica]|uniref:Sister chromatid cohesion protein PDS5 homologA-A n=1 Tax=Striga asiatica TaxID=4170 RepID=A0A5A7R856_STRAF|nr:sister chromatid cohesion protein PDS5 homologA-A [Striga asiatica]